MDDMPDITEDQARIIVANTPDDEIAKLYVAAWRFWRIVRQTNDHYAWLAPAAAIGSALDVEYEAPLLSATNP
jgi:hypothetical protein